MAFEREMLSMPSLDYMNISQTTPLPSPQQLHQELPMTTAQRHFVENARQEVRQILSGNDQRLLLIMGPCSIHDLNAAREYAVRLRQLSRGISDLFCVLMRVYFEKPRTAIGWKGLLYDPLLDGSHDIATGLQWTRQFMLELADMGMPVASELLDPMSGYYFGDLISWGCIGARTVSSQTHRQMASGLPMPIAFKNTTEGNVDVAINGILSAALPHTFIGHNSAGELCSVRTTGNLHGHLVLRGGESQPNYDPASISRALKRLRGANLPPSLLIDCSHDNSLRQHEKQIEVFQSVIHQVMEGNSNIRGVLIESHLEAGNQPLSSDPSKLKYAVSLTDPCLDWNSTEQLIRFGYALLKQDRLCETELQSIRD